MGLRIMRYRANLIGAVLSIEPRTPSGTIVQCAFDPLDSFRSPVYPPDSDSPNTRSSNAAP